MWFNTHLILLVIFAVLPFSSAKLLPAAIEVPAALEVNDVIVNITDRPDAVPLPRSWLPAINAQQHLSGPHSSSAQVKRTLLGRQEICPAGYGICSGKS